MNLIQNLSRAYPRHPQQLNKLFESDAEVIPLGSEYLCTSVDTVSEEISMGLIRDPETLGWLTTTVSASDLAAVGAKPESFSILVGAPGNWKDQRGFREGCLLAAEHYGASIGEFKLFEAESLITSCAAVGRSKIKPMFRMPLEVGDLLYLTGPIGWGNATALANIAITQGGVAQKIDSKYRPLARIQEGQNLLGWARSCLDTSDGLLFSMDLLVKLNGIGIEFDYGHWLFHPVALEVAALTRINPWLFLAAQNGEFELLFSIPSNRAAKFELSSGAMGLKPLKLGRVIEQKGLFVNTPVGRQSLDLGEVRNMLHDGLPVALYIRKMLELAELHGLGST